jgi:hypothetical protein
MREGSNPTVINGSEVRRLEREFGDSNEDSAAGTESAPEAP